MNKKKKMTKKEVKKKKITFASAILLVIGSTIGAGIFLKNGEVLGNVGHSAILALISWVLSIFGVVCMGVSLAEIASATTDSNLGIISWVKNFCHKYLFKVSKYFMALLYLPLNFFMMPYYAVLQIQDAFGWQTQWYIAAIIAFAITAWFFVMSGISSKLGNIQNKVVAALRFIPIAFCVVAGITLAIMNKGWTMPVPGQDPTVVWPEYLKNPGHARLAQMFPLLGIVGSIPAIIFSYDGFYSTAGIQSEMEEPKKTPAALVIGLVIVSIINLLVAISLLFGAVNGKVNGMVFLDQKGLHWLVGTMEMLIAVGILGVINGFAMYNPLYYQDLIKAGELPFSDKLQHKLATQKRNWVGLIYAGIITIVFFIVFTLVGAMGYADTIGYGSTGMVPFLSKTGEVVAYGYDKVTGIGSCNSLYSFCDLMANWTSIFAFLCIVFATIGAMINRKTNKIKVTKAKGFWFCSIVSVIVISIAILFIVVASVADIAIIAGWAKDIVPDSVQDGYHQLDWNRDILGAIMTLVMLGVFVAACCVPSSIEMHKEKKMHLARA
ncbi:MAG: APC family permease [Mycoplasma sp.]|nr:APC family permease [Candidatus Hennigella equi]